MRTYTTGLRLKTEKIITKNDIIIMCKRERLVQIRCGGAFNPLPKGKVDFQSVQRSKEQKFCSLFSKERGLSEAKTKPSRREGAYPREIIYC